LGSALLFGIGYALKKYTPDFVIQMDADWQHTPLLLPEFVKKIEEGADFVVGSRYIRGGSIPGNWGLHRKIYSIIGNNIVRLGLGKMLPHDWTSGYRMFRSHIFDKVKKGLEKYSGYTYQVAFLYRVSEAGYKIDEVPLQFSDRIHGKSKIAPLDYILNVLLYVFRKSKFIKYLIIGATGFLIQSLVSAMFIGLNMFAGVAVGIGAFLAICANFIGNNYWTFNKTQIRGKKNMVMKFLHFLTTSLVAVLIQVAVVTAGSWVWGEQYWFFYMVFALTFLVIPLNYFVYSKIIWRKS
jgi:dolichol-phosphate mannosyltransferase